MVVSHFLALRRGVQQARNLTFSYCTSRFSSYLALGVKTGVLGLQQIMFKVFLGGGGDGLQNSMILIFVEPLENELLGLPA